MGRTPQGNPAEFEPNQLVRYKPGTGTQYVPDVKVEDDGRVAAIVVGRTPKRVRIRYATADGRIVQRAVDADSLVRQQPNVEAVH